MKYRNLGNTGLRISEVSLGTWQTVGGRLQADTARSCVHAAIELGINFFDTADSYPGAEEALGAILRELPRAEYVVGTKCFFPLSDAATNRGLSRKHIVDSVHGSLRRLGLDYIDLFQCHRDDPSTPLEETVSALGDLVRQGKVLYWGVSRWPSGALRKAVASSRELGSVAPISHQLPYSMLFRDAEQDFELAHELGIGAIAYSPLAQGVLSGKYVSRASVPARTRAADADAVRTMHQFDEASLSKARSLRKIADDVGVPLSTLALAWCLRRPEIATALTGATNPDQVRQNARASGYVLTSEVLARVHEVLVYGVGS